MVFDYKAYGYACFYKSDANAADKINIRDITITLVSHGYPRKLARHLRKERGLEIEPVERGIYYVKGEFMPVQIIVSRGLTKEKNLWLRSLTNALGGRQEADELIESYKQHRPE